MEVSLFYNSFHINVTVHGLATDMTRSDDLAKIYNYEAQQNLAIIEFNKRKTKRVVRPKYYKPGKVNITSNFIW